MFQTSIRSAIKTMAYVVHKSPVASHTAQYVPNYKTQST